MRIAMVSQSYYPRLGGVTEHVHNLSEGLRRLGHEVTIITSGPGPADHDSTVRIGRNVMFPMNGAMVNVAVGLDLGGRLKRQFGERRYDLIHIHCPLEPTLPLAALAAAREIDVPVVGTFHMAAKTSAAYALFASVLAPYARRIDARVVVSQAARRFALRYFPGEYSVIPNGVDFAKFAGSAEVDAGLTDGKTNILYVGRLDVRKQVPWLISSFKKLHSKRPDVRLVIIGRGPTEPLCRLAAMPLAEGAIVFEGAVHPKDLPRFYASCHVFCSLPSGSESFGIVLLEAMAAGKPVVATAIDGYQEVITDGVEGLLVRPGDTDSLVAALETLVDDRRLRADMGGRGRERARAFDWSRVSRDVERLYASTLDTP